MTVGVRKRLRCPVCGSYRLVGSEANLKCGRCGFRHTASKPVDKSKLLIMEIGGRREC